VKHRFSDDLLRQYLLGELAENQQVEIEDRAFEDPKLLKSITALESDLIDEYVAGEIPVRKRERFETHFLAAAERKKKLAFARALHSVISNTQQQERTKCRVFFKAVVLRQVISIPGTTSNCLRFCGDDSGSAWSGIVAGCLQFQTAV
jgi:hypothetical protein